jgi:hypothetical protein
MARDGGAIKMLNFSSASFFYQSEKREKILKSSFLGFFSSFKIFTLELSAAAAAAMSREN